jgi:hypothetical protein
MKKKILFVLAAIILIVPQLVSAFEVTVQPRMKTGVMYYEYKQDAFQSPPRDAQGLFPNTSSDLEYKDWLPFVGGGVSFFFDRFFVDFSIQHAFNGSDSDKFRNSNFLTAGDFIPTDTVLTTDTNQDADIKRTEGAISLGYRVTDNIALFAGWLKAKTKFDTDLKGDIDTFQTNNLVPIPFLSGTFKGDLDQKFKYDGPFVGANLSMPIQIGFLEGAVSGNASVAFLDGKVELDFRNVTITNQLGITTEFDLQGAAESQGRGSFSDLNGDAVAIALGLSWTGLTPVEGLTYSVGAYGYRYDFDSDDSNDTPDYSETQIRFDLGIAYAFDFEDFLR